MRRATESRPSEGRRMSRRKRRSGLTLIEVLVVLAIIAVLVGLMAAALLRARDSAYRVECANHLRQIGIGLHSYHAQYGRLPPGSNNWGPESAVDYKYCWLSWMALILPFVDQEPLWRQTDQREEIGSQPGPTNNQPAPYNWSFPWDIALDGSQRYAGVGTVLSIYTCPADSRTLQSQHVQDRNVAMTAYLGVSGPSIAAWSVNAPTDSAQLNAGGPGVLVPTNKYD